MECNTLWISILSIAADWHSVVNPMPTVWGGVPLIIDQCVKGGLFFWSEKWDFSLLEGHQIITIFSDLVTSLVFFGVLLFHNIYLGSWWFYRYFCFFWVFFFISLLTFSRYFIIGVNGVFVGFFFLVFTKLLLFFGVLCGPVFQRGISWVHKLISEQVFCFFVCLRVGIFLGTKMISRFEPPTPTHVIYGGKYISWAYRYFKFIYVGFNIS